MEIQAVILAGGRGSQMLDLTSATPKPLLPVANRPLIWYTVNILQKYGFQNTIVVCQSSHAGAVQKALLSFSVEVISMKDDDESDTLDALRHIKNKIKTDALILSCDLITDFEFHKLFDIYRIHNPTVTMLLAKSRPELENIPGVKMRKKARTLHEIVGLTKLTETTQQVVLIENEADIEDDYLSIRKRVLNTSCRIRLRTDLTDCHAYIIKRWLLDYLEHNGQNASLRREFLPYIVRKQFAKDSHLNQNEMSSEIENVDSNALSKDILKFVPAQDDFEKITEITLKGDGRATKSLSKLSCCASICDEDVTCFRVNNMSTYIDANRQVSKQWTTLVPSLEGFPLVHSTVNKPDKTQIGNDCVVGEGTVMGERSSFKRSVIGRNCIFASHVKISNCVVYDNVRIDKNCNIQNSVLCANVHIEESCSIKDCFIQTEKSISASSNLTSDSIVDGSTSMVEFN